MECLFAIINGDDLYMSFANLDEEAKSQTYLWWFLRLYIYSFVVLFTYVVLNLFLTIILDAYTLIKVQNPSGIPPPCLPLACLPMQRNP
jgi:mucolipin 1